MTPEKLKQTVAYRIADMYLERFPREKRYAITLASSDLEHEREETFYYPMLEEDLSVLRKWESLNDEERKKYDNLEGFLSTLDKDEQFRDMCLEPYSYPWLDVIDDCDTRNPLRFTEFTVRTVNADYTLEEPRTVIVPLTDEEYKKIFAYAIQEHNHLSMNNLIYRLPEIAAKITKHISYALYDFMVETFQYFIFEATEIHNAIDEVLDPNKDVLGICNSDDVDIWSYCQVRIKE